MIFLPNFTYEYANPQWPYEITQAAWDQPKI